MPMEENRKYNGGNGILWFMVLQISHRKLENSVHISFVGCWFAFLKSLTQLDIEH